MRSVASPDRADENDRSGREAVGAAAVRASGPQPDRHVLHAASGAGGRLEAHANRLAAAIGDRAGAAFLIGEEVVEGVAAAREGVDARGGADLDLAGGAAGGASGAVSADCDDESVSVFEIDASSFPMVTTGSKQIAPTFSLPWPLPRRSSLETQQS